MTGLIVRDRLYVKGGWTAATESHVTVFDTVTGAPYGRVPAATPSDVDDAVAAATDAFPSWAATDVEDRATLCERLADALEGVRDEMARTITHEVGTPSTFSSLLHGGTLQLLLRHYAAMAREYPWETEVAGALVRREPIGVVAAITPWNYPTTLVAYKVPAALLAGCTVVLKPSELAPLSAFLLAEKIDEVGFPPGAFNLVTGGPLVGEHLVSHPGVDMVSFTGSTATGAKVAAGAAATITRVHLELGGKSAAIVLDDADLDSALSSYLQQVFMNNGQTCLAWSRLLVPRQRHDEVAERLAAMVEAQWQAGDPTGPALVGPLVSAVQRDRVTGYIRRGIDEGATLVTGGAEPPEQCPLGYYVRPTVFAGATNDMAIARDEIFGPVVTVIGYDDEDDAVRIANDSPYGLHGAVLTSDVDHGIELARRLRTGQVDINQFTFNPSVPFGGYKQSGEGRELGKEGFEAYLETKSINALPTR